MTSEDDADGQLSQLAREAGLSIAPRLLTALALIQESAAFEGDGDLAAAHLFVGVEERDVEAKIRAMQTYRGEARPDPHPRSPEVLRALAKVRGSEGGFYFAEAFMIQKMFA